MNRFNLMFYSAGLMTGAMLLLTGCSLHNTHGSKEEIQFKVRKRDKLFFNNGSIDLQEVRRWSCNRGEVSFYFKGYTDRERALIDCKEMHKAWHEYIKEYK